jgi:hypothetical protein
MLGRKRPTQAPDPRSLGPAEYEDSGEQLRTWFFEVLAPTVDQALTELARQGRSQPHKLAHRVLLNGIWHDTQVWVSFNARQHSVYIMMPHPFPDQAWCNALESCLRDRYHKYATHLERGSFDRSPGELYKLAQRGVRWEFHICIPGR